MTRAVFSNAPPAPNLKSGIFALFTACVLLLLALHNVLQFPRVNARSPSWAAFHTWKGSPLDHHGAVKNSYGLYFDLGRIAPGAKIVLPANTDAFDVTAQPEFVSLLAGLGRAGAVEREGYDPNSAPRRNLYRNHIKAKGKWRHRYVEGRQRPPQGAVRFDYSIAAAPEPVEKLYYFTPRDRRLVFIDARLLEPTGVEGASE